MTSTKDEKIRSQSPLNCCVSNDSLTSNSADAEDVVIRRSDTINVCMTDTVNFHTNVQQVDNHKFPKRPPADLVFDNICYNTWTWSMTRFRKEYKEIIHGVSGKFKSGELTAIMGPSGAGKTTLLNVLAGYITSGSSGSVCVNDKVRDQSLRFRKLTAYIPQDEEVRLELTPLEAMTVAANLKLGYKISPEHKMQQITKILKMLGLNESHHTRSGHLSGGQKKRLAIALELISNPPILFLDEPTTGLDSLSCSQCVALLKRLAQDGRTVICTIHQPSALVFEMFDHLYALSDGRCIYKGSITGLVPHLASLGLQCPSYHNPADFLIEVASGEYNNDPAKLAAAVDKLADNNNQYIEPKSKDKKAFNTNNCSLKTALTNITPENTSASVFMQFLLLYRRNILSARRNYLYLVNRLAAHILIGLLFGYLYQGVGKGADTALGNYVYLYGSMLLIVYTGKMSVTLSFPLEMKILNTEHFNRWYNLTPYLLSVVLVEIPFQILCTWSYIAISYWLTQQPLDFRLYLFIILCTLSTLCAQAWGYFIGATTPIKVAVFLGPVLACLFSVFGFCIRYYDTPAYLRWMFHISYYRAGFQGIVFAMYGFNRTDLECPDEKFYCHYKNTNKILQEMGTTDINLASNISLIIFIGGIVHCLTYLSLWLKLNKR